MLRTVMKRKQEEKQNKIIKTIIKTITTTIILVNESWHEINFEIPEWE